MDEFVYLNGDKWYIRLVDHNDPILIDRTGLKTVGVTDPTTRCIYISDALDKDFFVEVLLHEIGHCAIISYNLLNDIHKAVKREYWTLAEEWVCNFIVDYGISIIDSVYDVLNTQVLNGIPCRWMSD